MKRMMCRIGTLLLCLSLLSPAETMAEEAPFYGYRPPIDRPSVERDADALRRKQTNLPAKFDLRTARVSPVKNQHQNGDCWSFATMGALESHLLPGALYDFSEKHLVNHVGFENVSKKGGNMHMAQSYLARAEGPVDESEDPYESSGVVDGLQPKVYLKTAYRLATEEIKEALMRYGAVQTAVYADDENGNIFNKEHSAQYAADDWRANHEVVIVGWDDTYPKENFSVQPKENGAWIVRNSWGEEWGDQGYYYVSYEDRTIAEDNMVYAEVAESKWYERLYQYDEYGSTGKYGYPDAEYNWFANVFTTQSAQERIKAAAFYTNEPDMEYELYVDPNFNGAWDGLRKVGGGRMEYAGYHTVELPAEELVSGERFAVAVRLRTKNVLPIAVEQNHLNYLHRAIANRDESFISTDGKRWEDVKDSTYTKDGQEVVLDANVCLKAFTVGGDVPQLSLEPQELQEAKWWSEDELTTSDPAKVWRVRFSQVLDLQSIDGQVKVFDVADYREIEVTADTADEGDTVLVRPQEMYQQGKEYILYVGKVQSISGKELRPIKAKFRVE